MSEDAPPVVARDTISFRFFNFQLLPIGLVVNLGTYLLALWTTIFATQKLSRPMCKLMTRDLRVRLSLRTIAIGMALLAVLLRACLANKAWCLNMLNYGPRCVDSLASLLLWGAANRAPWYVVTIAIYVAACVVFAVVHTLVSSFFLMRPAWFFRNTYESR